MNGRVLIAAGSDSGGGAGIQADTKTVTCLGGFATTAITALTAQNTQGVFGIVPLDPAFIAQQMLLVLSDIGADAIKTGMLHSVDVIERVAGVIDEAGQDIPIVVDPVMVAKGGHALLDPDASSTLRERLCPLATVLTPNIPEATELTHIRIHAHDDMLQAAEALLELGPYAVFLKGGHMDGDVIQDVLATRDGMETFESPRINTKHTHGTGCTTASAIATGLAQGLSLRDAVMRARAYVHRAIATAPGYGHGHGPLNHAHTVKSDAEWA